MSNHESKPLDTQSLFPAGCVHFLRSYTKQHAKVWHLWTPPTGRRACTHCPACGAGMWWMGAVLSRGEGRRHSGMTAALFITHRKYKTTQPAAALISRPGICLRRPQHLQPPSAAQEDSVALPWAMLGRQIVWWHLLALLSLPFCLCQDEYMEVSGRANKAVARIVQSHQQTGRSGSRREKVRERSHPRTGTVDNNTSTDLKPLRPDELPHPEVEDLAQINPFWGQVLWILF